MSPLLSSISGGGPFPILLSTTPTTTSFCRRFSTSFASLDSPQPKSKSTPSSSKTPFDVDSFSKSSDNSFNYALANPNGNDPALQFTRSTESDIEKVIFDFRFLALLAVAGSLAGSLLCFLDGCVYIIDAYKIYWTGCLKGNLSGKMVTRLVEAIDVYLAGTVMLIFAMGLYGLFISNSPDNIPPAEDRALKSSSLFGMFTLRERPQWMKISSLDELKTKVGHVIVMILLVKMFEKSKMVTISTGLDLLTYSLSKLWTNMNIHSKGDQLEHCVQDHLQLCYGPTLHFDDEEKGDEKYLWRRRNRLQETCGEEEEKQIEAEKNRTRKKKEPLCVCVCVDGGVNN